MILAYNTSLADLDIGLFSGNAELLDEFHYQPSADERGIHDKLLAQKTSDLLKEISASPKDISRIAFINGPGSFTGLRIGLAFAKGLAFGNKNIRLVPLIAHSVLLETYRRSKITNHESPVAILYPGYSKDSVYCSYSDDPEKISYIKITELFELHLTTCICPPQVVNFGIPHNIIPISLQVMAELALSESAPGPLSDLEPFYGTDFKPTV